MNMNILCLYGSPHPGGNSATVANAFLEAAGESGAGIKTFELYALKFSGCKACMACKTDKESCVIDDDLTPVLEAIGKTDVLLLAAPIYNADITAAMRAFIERTHSFLGPGYGPLPGESRLAPGKKIVFVTAQGNKEDMFTDVYPRYNKFFKWYGFEESYLIRACGVVNPGEVKNQPQKLEQAKNLAQKLCQSKAFADASRSRRQKKRRLIE
jgi:multimeric flavodoxin WrbA